MPRPTFARVDLGAIVHNYRIAAAQAGSARAMAVVKANGYGHGIGAVAAALEADVGCFAVACLEEALAIRAAGSVHPVVLLQGVHEAADMALCGRQGFEPVLHSGYQADWLLAEQTRPQVWIKVNTGMNRLGFRPEELPALVQRLQTGGVSVRGFMSHFASADQAGSNKTEAQTRCFVEAVRPWPDKLRSVANSAAHFRAGQPLFDWTRPGIMLYGASPFVDRSAQSLGLKPAMSFESRLIAVRTLKPGEPVGYGETWRAPGQVTMGIVAAGYGDGYPRHAGTGTPASVNGHRVTLIGRVSMDMLAVDLTGVPQPAPGDTVELWGKQVSVDEVAKHAGTIGYELLTGLTRRVPRVYSTAEHPAGTD
ncbi:alanine racemase [Marinobacter sp. X15-166B]|uniref:alanine racemase n=1 Tax=Marinobacter sp. X15-166B TaxID=1897620 RepID=UPI00085CB66B|nr:alanine racemase [Marinobacter sp. X15-166B]OEY66775.1 alanine racemase [Marinobacter sp. X15-166B]